MILLVEDRNPEHLMFSKSGYLEFGRYSATRIPWLCPPFQGRSPTRFDSALAFELFEIGRVDADHPPDLAVTQPLRLAPVQDRIADDAQAFSGLFSRQKAV